MDIDAVNDRVKYLSEKYASRVVFAQTYADSINKVEKSAINEKLILENANKEFPVHLLKSFFMLRLLRTRVIRHRILLILNFFRSLENRVFS